MRVTTILAATALAVASLATTVPASAQQYPPGRNVNDGGIAAEPTGAPQYNGSGAVVAAPGNEVSGSNCAARFHSFDPATGTYTGRDGQRHPCP
jgi:hypothetical protein